VLLIDMLRAVLGDDPFGRTQKVKGEIVPLGTGWLAEALALACRTRCSSGGCCCCCC